MPVPPALPDSEGARRLQRAGAAARGAWGAGPDGGVPFRGSVLALLGLGPSLLLAGPSPAGRTWVELGGLEKPLPPSLLRGGFDLEHAVALLRSEPRHVETLLAQPLRQRVGTQIALHDQVGGPARLQPRQPRQQEVVERRLADPHRPGRVDGGGAKP